MSIYMPENGWGGPLADSGQCGIGLEEPCSSIVYVSKVIPGITLFAYCNDCKHI